MRWSGTKNRRELAAADDAATISSCVLSVTYDAACVRFQFPHVFGIGIALLLCRSASRRRANRWESGNRAESKPKGPEQRSGIILECRVRCDEKSPCEFAGRRL